MSHLTPRCSGSKKKQLRRNISWDVRPPRVHQINNTTLTKPTTTTTTTNPASVEEDEETSSNDGDNKNVSWYSVSQETDV